MPLRFFGISGTRSGATRHVAGMVCLLALLGLAATARAETVLLAADAAKKGAATADNKVYLAVAETLIAEFKKAGYKVVEPEAIPQQYLARKRRPSTEDWLFVFGHNVPPTDALVTVAVVNRIMRTPTMNASSVDLIAHVYRRGQQKAVAVVEQPAKKDWPMSAGCFGPCMMRVLSENVVAPAGEFARTIIQTLKKSQRRK